MPFWRHCSSVPVKATMFPFKRLVYQEEFFVSGSNGPWHSFKRFSLHASAGCRTIRYGDAFVDLGCMLRGGLQTKAYLAQDPQSDLQSCQRLHMGYCPGSFDDLGARIHCFINCLIASSWTASNLFTEMEQAENLPFVRIIARFCTIEFLICLLFPLGVGMSFHWGWWFPDVLEAHGLLLAAAGVYVSKVSAWQKKWLKHWLPLSTWRNSCAVCAHGIIGLMGTTQDARFRTELPVEQFYSRIKAPFRGTPCVKDGIYGTVLDHQKQMKRLQSKPAGPSPKQQPRQKLTDDQVGAASVKALHTACQFQSAITADGKDAAVWKKDLLSWWFQAFLVESDIRKLFYIVFKSLVSKVRLCSWV